MAGPKTTRWREAAQHLASVVNAAPTEQSEYLAALQASDPELAELTATLIEATAVRASVGQQRSADGAAQTLALERGQRIGHFTIDAILAAGGMGAVYRATQDAPARTVALKVLRGDMLEPSLRFRFAEEVEILGRLHHPSIAEIYEAGEFQLDGCSLPYFAMATWMGGPLTNTWHTLIYPVASGLIYFFNCLDAVQYAHQQGIIHRDLKPANVMVDSRQRVRILDFGIARLQRRDGAGPTEFGSSPGTLAYMSPEQLSGNPAEIDTRSDLYALGIMLFELLSGQRAFDLSKLSLQQSIEQRQWGQAPSLALVCADVPRDLDAIVSKALAGERKLRYATADEFATDLRCYLENRPVGARSPGAVYLLGKFLRRRPGLSLALGALMISVVFGVLATAVAYREARHQEQLAQQQRDAALEARATAEQVSRYFSDLMALASPDALGPDLRVTELIGRAEEDLANRFDDTPALQASLSESIGWLRFLNADYEQAERLQRQAWQTHLQLFGQAHERTLQSRTRHLTTLVYLREEDDLGSTVVRHRDNVVASLGLMHPEALQADYVLALWHYTQGEFAPAERTLRDTLERAVGNDAQRRRARLSLFGLLGGVLSELGQPAEAETILREVLAIRLQQLGPRHPDTLVTRLNLAETLVFQGQYRAGEAIYRQTMLEAADVWADEHANWQVVHTGLANALMQQTRYEAAERHAAMAYR